MARSGRWPYLRRRRATAKAPPNVPNAMGRSPGGGGIPSASTLSAQEAQKTDLCERRASQAAQQGGLSASASAVRSVRTRAVKGEERATMEGPSTRGPCRLRLLFTKAILPGGKAVGSRLNRERGREEDSTLTEWRWTDERGVQRLVGTEELRAALAGSVLPSSTLVWREGMKEWAPASSIPE